MRRTLSLVVCALVPCTLAAAGCGGPPTGTDDAGVQPDASDEDGGATLRTLSVIVSGMGSVTSSPPGIDCGSDCEEAYPEDTTVTLTAAPSATWLFAGWAGACTGTDACVVTMDAVRAVSATFTQEQYDVQVVREGSGTGTVTSTPGGIDCGTDCVERFAAGTTVTLTATPGTASRFAGWSGACSGAAECVLDVAAATSVVATFTATATVTVALAGTGAGTVTSVPAGIACDGDCSEPFDTGTTVELTPTASPGSRFEGWSGGGCTGTGACSVTVTSDVTVTATFAPRLDHSLSSGWSCGSGVSCQDVYDLTLLGGTTVTIAVTGVSGSSVVRLAAFGPGVAPSGDDLLTGRSSDRMCVGQNASDTVTFRARDEGTYRIAVGRDWGSSAGASGSYTLSITTTRPLVFDGQSGDDVATSASGTRCGYIYTATGAWSCSGGVSCQDVYDFDSFTATTMTVAISSVTGSSVPRLAVFDGGALDTTNRLNGNLADRRCVGQNASDTATTGSLPVGHHRVAVGRDWGSSAGASGTYTITITTPNVPLVVGGGTTDDVSSSFATTTCP